VELRSLQSSQATRLEQEARSDANAAIASQVIDLVNEVIIIDGDDIGDAVPEAFDQIIKDLDLTTTTVQPVCKKRHQNVSRPDNWREIIQHYMIHKNSASTIAKYCSKSTDNRNWKGEAADNCYYFT
jgi:hypothetical protein